MADGNIEQAWEQISLDVDQAHAEQLAELLGEFLSGGVVMEKYYGDLFPWEVDEYQGPVRVYGYFPAKSGNEIREPLTTALEKSGLADFYQNLKYSPLENKNWTTAWQERYKPILVGKNFVVVPSWLENPYPGRVQILMDPGLAFGSGTHPTTQLCLALLESVLDDFLPREMIDVGCGSGILAIGGVKRGVKKVLGVDIDPDAIRVSNENAVINEVSENVFFRLGSVKEILDLTHEKPGSPLVVANMIAPILLQLFEEGLGELVEPGGKIILSGILLEQKPEILACLERTGFNPVDEIRNEGWVALVGEKIDRQ